MIALGARRVFLCGEPVDMRMGIDGLSAQVVGRLQRDPNAGDVFVFIGKRANRLKALCWDRDGFWLCMKRLACGRFIVPRSVRTDGLPSTLELSHADWQLLLDGIVVRDRVLVRRYGRDGESGKAAIMRA